MFYKFLFFLSDFLEIQRKSFYLFLKSGLGADFWPRNFFSENYKFRKPILNIEKSILFGKTYCCHFYFPIQFAHSNSKQLQWVFLGTLPLLTRRGHFIINGTPRVVLNQIVRSAGLYFQKRESESFQVFYAEIILERGPWIQFELDSQQKIWMCHQYKPRILLSRSKQKLKLMNDFLKLSDQFYLGQNGRDRCNKKLGLCLQTPVLTSIDFAAISTILFKNEHLDDIEDLKNRKLKTIGELIQNQLIRAVLRLQNKHTIKKQNLSIVVNSTLKEFFHSHQLSQYLDQSNPLSEITHKRRLSCGGVTAGMETRSIHRTHYGRICPIETPEGKNAGLVNSLTTAVKLNTRGFLETPFVEIYKQHFQNQTKLSFLSVEMQEQKNTFFNNKLPKHGYGSIGIVEIQGASQYQLNSVYRIAKTVQQFLSIATTCIPFIEHNDANRALMGSNMQRQALPLIFTKAPIVSTSNAFRVLSDLKDIPISVQSSFLIYVSKKKICLINSAVQVKKASVAKIQYITFQKFQYNVLQNFEKSNQNTYFLQRPIPYTSQWIQKGDLLSDCSASSQGDLALGQNLLVGYMSWEGLNFEDAVLISKQILTKYISLHIEKYVIEIGEFEKILGIPKIGSWVKEGDVLLGKMVPKEPSILLTHDKLLHDIINKTRAKREFENKYLKVPSSGRIIRICYTHMQVKRKKISQSLHPALHNVRYVENCNVSQIEDVIALKRFNILTLDSAESTGNFFYKANSILPSKPENRKADLRYADLLSQRFFKGEQNFVSSLKKITIYIAKKRMFQVGDKISGRHGNKGIISKILPNCDMPYLPNGDSLDVLLNPLGVPSRMNVGQIFECLLGFAGQIFQTKFEVLCFDEIYGYEASRSLIYSKLFSSCKTTGQKWLFSKQNPGKFHLFDGRNGELFNQSILVGCPYLMKLIHIVDEKIHARSTGPYSFVTQQPLRGRAKKGGQRFGEMEVWALEGFGSAYAIQELLTVKSDDLQGRNKIMQTLLKNTSFKFGTPESLRVTLRELQCLCLCLKLENK
uniref:DNA-directed RNA polymerase subunit beta n=1 Tax=Halimeda discoidea TaxID=118222 RepID=A0A1C9JB08_9CHLO|nr:RNA polymerase b-subunit [Halimeda discoidea]